MTKQQAIETINASFPSIWSKEDVLQLINKIDEGTAGFNKEELYDKIRGAVDDAINGLSNDEIVDVSSCEFEIKHGNEIYVESIGINTGDIIDQVMSDVESALDDYIAELEEAKEEQA